MLERIRDRRFSRRALRLYARNGWESPWFRKNRLWDSILHR